jgi:hypothetical protein
LNIYIIGIKISVFNAFNQSFEVRFSLHLQSVLI